jgi:8-oxo-dGTP diphosphatase
MIMASLALAAAIVIHENRVLIVRRSRKEKFLPGRWGVPCGKIDPGELAADAVLRELREETGLSGDVVCFAGRSTFRSVWRGRSVENRQSNFLVEPIIDPDDTDESNMPRVRPPEADQDSKWVAADKIENVGLDSHNLRTIRQALDARNRHPQLASTARSASN